VGLCIRVAPFGCGAALQREDIDKMDDSDYGSDPIQSGEMKQRPGCVVPESSRMAWGKTIREQEDGFERIAIGGE
jgi:hypothetical protein